MFTLHLLGGASLEGPNGPVTGKAAQRRRLALLAILASARGRGVGRERVIGLLWPEHSADAARHLLSEALYVLRKELGEAAFVSAADEVGLNAEVVQSDVRAFEAAMEEGDLESAARTYRGPFLDGFYVPGALEFERWVESERDRLARAHTRALECLAEADERAGRPRDAAEWWRRLAVADPYNSRVGVRLMLAMDAAGERAAALWFAETHAALLREELGVEPGRDFEAAVERLKTEPVSFPPPSAPAALPAPDASFPFPAPPREPEPGTEAHAAPRAPSFAGPRPAPFADAGVERAPAPAVTADPASPAPDPGAGGKGTLLDAAPPAPAAPAAHSSPPAARARLLPALAGLLIGLAGLAAVLWALRRDAPAAVYDARRIAVLYFDDHSRNGELGYLASGLTEMLIHELSQVEALDVISRNGVKPYRDASVPFDSMVADLRVGSVVEGSIQRSGDSVRVTVQLVDAASKSHLESRTVLHPLSSVFSLEDRVAREVSGFLRRRLGREVQLRQTRASTRSEEAWRLLWQAREVREAIRRAARAPGPGVEVERSTLLARADSLLARAERADPGWGHPTLERGWVAYEAGRREGGAGADSLFRAAQERAARVLAREPRSAEALELRGVVRFERAAGAGRGQEARVDSAERDLRAAVAAEPSLASAWSRLSRLLRYRGRVAESDLAARRALAEDAYLDDAPAIYTQLFFGAMLMEDYPQARSLCETGRQRFSADWRFLECELTLLREDRSRPPDPARAWRLVADLDRLDPPPRAAADGRAYSPVYRRAVTAAILARAGERDSARAVLARARGMVAADPERTLDLAYDEAYVLMLLGEREAARARLAEVLAHRSWLHDFARKDPLFRELLTDGPLAGESTTKAAPPPPSPP